MRYRWRLSAVLPAIVIAAACGSSGSALSPQNVGTITGITLTVNPPPVGSSVAAVGKLSLSTGTTPAVTTGFTSDTPSVATVTSAGVVTGVSIGDVTISVDYQGFKASKKVRVLPSYTGIYFGSYTVDSCTETGDFIPVGNCAKVTAQPTLPLQFASQQSLDLTTLAGQFALGSAVGDATGAVAPDGALTYGGAFVSGTFRIDVQNFAGSVPAIGQMSGHFEQLWTDSTLTGQVLIKCTIHDMTRTSGGLLASALAGRAIVSGPADVFTRVTTALRR